MSNVIDRCYEYYAEEWDTGHLFMNNEVVSEIKADN